MIIVKSTDLVKVVTATGADVDVHASWVDLTGTTAAPGRTNTQITTATTTTVVGSPAGGTDRNVRHLMVRNVDSISQTVTIQHDDGSTTVKLWAGTLLAGEGVEYDGDKFQTLSAGGIPSSVYAGGPVDIQSSTTGGNTTGWTKPTAFTPKFVTVVCYGGGGGGGGGGSLASGGIHTGGAGGGGGARAERTYAAGDLGSTEPWSVANGGTSGSGGIAAGGAGGSGGAGQNTTFSSGVTLLTAFGGGGGAPGQNSSAANAGGAGGGLSAAGGTGTASAATGGGPGAPATPNGGCGANSLATAGAPVCAEYGGGAGGGAGSGIGAAVKTALGANGGLAAGLLGGLAGAVDSGDKSATSSRDPWAPMQPYLLGLAKDGADLYQKYRQQPFSPAQQTAYGNVGGLLDALNQSAPALLAAMQQTAGGDHQFVRGQQNRIPTYAGPGFNFQPGAFGNFGTKG